MKKLNVLLIAVALTVTNVLSASTTPTKADKPKNTTTLKIIELLENPGFEVYEEVKANVTVVVNDLKEVVVLSVDTENSNVASFIKSRLNYQKINNLRQGERYEFAVRIIAES